MEAKKEISTIDLGNMIADHIQENPYFNRADFIKQFGALVKMFRLKIETFNYNKIEKPTLTARLIRQHHLMNLEKNFYKDELYKLVGKEEMELKYTQILNEQRKNWEE